MRIISQGWVLSVYLFGLTQLTPGQIARGDLAPVSQGDGILTIADVYRLIGLI